MVRPAAVSQRRSTRAISDQMASAQNRASEYSMASTIEPGATAHSAAMSRPTRRSPVSSRPSRASPHAAASPAAIVTARAARVVPVPGIQEMVSMAAGYPGNQANMEPGCKLPGSGE